MGRIAIVAIAVIVQGGYAMHTSGCVPEAADSSTYTMVTPPDGGTYYVEERPNDGSSGSGSGYDVEPPMAPPPPAWGFLVGDGTYVYEEGNGVPGLQRGDEGALGPCLVTILVFCILSQIDQVADENCGHGPDRALAMAYQ